MFDLIILLLAKIIIAVINSDNEIIITDVWSSIVYFVIANNVDCNEVKNVNEYRVNSNSISNVTHQKFLIWVIINIDNNGRISFSIYL